MTVSSRHYQDKEVSKNLGMHPFGTIDYTDFGFFGFLILATLMDINDLRIVEKFKALVSQKIKVHEIRIFGSRARGDSTEESDIDVLVVVDALNHSIEKYISDCAWESGFSENVIVAPITISLGYLKK